MYTGRGKSRKGKAPARVPQVDGAWDSDSSTADPSMHPSSHSRMPAVCKVDGSGGEAASARPGEVPEQAHSQAVDATETKEAAESSEAAPAPMQPSEGPAQHELQPARAGEEAGGQPATGCQQGGSPLEQAATLPECSEQSGAVMLPRAAALQTVPRLSAQGESSDEDANLFDSWLTEPSSPHPVKPAKGQRMQKDPAYS